MKRFYVIVAVFWFAQYIYVPFLSPYLVLLGIPASIVGIVAGSYGFTQMALRIPLAVGGSIRGNHKFYIGAGLVAVAASCVLPLLSQSWVFFLLMRMLAGIASATWVSYSAYLLEAGGEGASRSMGYLMAAYAVGVCSAQAAGTAFYRQLGEMEGMRAIFLAAVFTSLAGFALLLATPFRRRAEGEARAAFTKQSFFEVLKNWHLWRCSMLASILMWILFSTNYSFTGVYAQERLGAGALPLGLITIICQLAAFGTSFAIGRAKGALPEKRLLLAGFALFALYCALQPYSALAPLLLLQIVCGVAYSLLNVLLLASAGRELSKDQQLLAMGVFQSLYSIGMTAGPAVTGAVLERSGGHFPLVFLVLAAIALGGFAWTAKSRGLAQ
ncbi:MAG: MFS transporter [Clostridiales Family XIII bacterium]|jgi:predicted MFS family arabinose efflux permease|nr:MFS transporter [Clostridiales Family XIII bacterium]